MNGNLIEQLARDILGRPDALMVVVEVLREATDGIDAVRVEMADVPPCATGKRKGKPNWRKASNRQTRILSYSQLKEAAEVWQARTGLCLSCTGEGRQFVSWHHIEGTTWKPCTPCGGSGKAAP